MNLCRDFVADLEVRADGDGRTVHGIVVPFGQVARVSDGGPAYDETFQAGAFAKNLRERTSPVKLLSQHDPRNPIGIATEMREDTAGLYGAFRVSDTAFARDQLELVRDGVLDSFSVGFRGIKHVKRGGVVVRTEAAIREASLVTFPAYDGAAVAGIRSLDDFDDLLRAYLAERGVETVTTEQLAAALAGDPNTSLAERLDAALAAGVGTPSGAAADEPLPEHSSRRLPNSFRLALRERGLISTKENTP